MKKRLLVALVIGACTSTAVLALAPASFGQETGASGDFNAFAQAPVFQVTEDEPTATFHPEGEGNFNYALATLAQDKAYALSSFFWPGGAAGNAGSLAQVLGAPEQASQANDPVRAEAISGTPPPEKTTTTPSGATMSASVKPADAGPQATATTSTSDSGSALGAIGSVGSTKSQAMSSENASTGLVAASASSFASGIDLGGVLHIGSVSSTASVKSDDSKPSGGTVFAGVTVAGQDAYVDGNGLHMGKPGQPANAESLGLANTALAGAGMKIYFTAADTIPVGPVKYYYAASVLVFWQPPGSQNIFTVSMGGAAVSLSGSGSPPSDALGADTGDASIPASPGGSGGAVLSLPTSGPAVPSIATPGRAGTTEIAQPASLAVATPHGVGKWAIAVLGGLLAGGLALPHIPALFTATAEAGCERERRLRTLFRRW
jgi:hypothetical protein